MARWLVVDLAESEMKRKRMYYGTGVLFRFANTAFWIEIGRLDVKCNAMLFCQEGEIWSRYVVVNASIPLDYLSRTYGTLHSSRWLPCYLCFNMPSLLPFPIQDAVLPSLWSHLPKYPRSRSRFSTPDFYFHMALLSHVSVPWPIENDMT